MPNSDTKSNDLQSRAVVTKDRTELQEATWEDSTSAAATEAAEDNGPNLPKRVTSAEIFSGI